MRLQKLFMGLCMVLLGLVLTGQTVFSQGQSVPTANAEGDFVGRVRHQFWTVVETGGEMSCQEINSQEHSPRSRQLPRRTRATVDVSGQVQAVKTFGYGTVLRAQTAPTGLSTETDAQGLPWLTVRYGRSDQICWVRANSALIEPIP